MEIASFSSACGSNKFHGSKNKLSCSITSMKVLSESGKNVHKYNLIIKSMNEHRQSAFPMKNKDNCNNN